MADGRHLSDEDDLAERALWAALRHVDQAWADSTTLERLARVTAARALFTRTHPGLAGAALVELDAIGPAYCALASTVAVALGGDPADSTVRALWDASVDADRLRAAAAAPAPTLAPLADALTLAVSHLDP